MIARFRLRRITSARCKSAAASGRSGSRRSAEPPGLFPIGTRGLGGPRSAKWRRASSLADDFHEHALAAATVEFAVKDLFPRAEVELSVRDRDDDLPPHHLPFEVSVSIVLTSEIMVVLRSRFVRSELFEPN